MDTKASPGWNVYDERCPTRMVLGRLADKWTVLVVGQLAQGTRRFGELRREIRGISPKVLTQALRALERDGLIVGRTETVLDSLGRPTSARLSVPSGPARLDLTFTASEASAPFAHDVWHPDST